MTEVIVKKGIEDVELYGKIDRNRDGDIASEVPSWYMTQHKEELSANIEQVQGQLDREMIPQSEKPIITSRLRQMKERLEKINEAEPKFNDTQQESISKVSDTLGKKIKESMFSLSDMKKGVVDAHEEARRMADPCIKLSGDEYTLAKKAGCRVSSDGKVSRNDAEKVWKICRRIVGESTNSEALRRN